jgi:hypothetical protein
MFFDQLFRIKKHLGKKFIKQKTKHGTRLVKAKALKDQGLPRLQLADI